MREPDAVVVRGAPHPGVRGDGHAELARDLVRRLLGERRVAGDVERHLEAQPVVVEHAAGEGLEVRRGRPLPRGLLDVAVGQHVAAGDGAQRVDRGLRVLDGLQAVRPVHARGDARVERLGGGEQVARAHVLRAEVLAGLQVVPDEVLGERPVGAVAAHGRLPHVPVGVDHAGHDDAVTRVDLPGALGHGEIGADGGDAVARDEHVGIGQHAVLRVEGEHRAAAQHDRGLIRHRPSPGLPSYRTVVRHTVVGGSVRVKE